MKVKRKANVIGYKKKQFSLFLNILFDQLDKTQKHDVSFRFK